MIQLRFTIRNKPVPLARARINMGVVKGWLKRGMRGMPGPLMYTPSKSKNWQKTVAMEARQAIVQRAEFPHLMFPLLPPVCLTLTFWLKRPKTLSKYALRPDIDNYAKNVMDGLSGVIFEDDSYVQELHVHRKWVDHKDEERTEIIVQGTVNP